MRRIRSRRPTLEHQLAAGGGALPAAARRRRRQGGFTLIEMLVVISILGIMACIVTVSMVGLSAVAQRRADDQELMTVQSAMNFMLTDQLVDPDVACSAYAGPPGGTSDMSEFPSAAARPAPGPDPVQSAGHEPVQLWPHYLRGQTTHRSYRCVSNGKVVPAAGS